MSLPRKLILFMKTILSKTCQALLVLACVRDKLLKLMTNFFSTFELYIINYIFLYETIKGNVLGCML